MNLENFLDYVLFTVRGFDVKLSIILLAVLMTASIVVIQRLVLKRVLPSILSSQEVPDANLRKLKRRFNLTLLVLLLLGLWYSTGIQVKDDACAIHQ